MLISISNPTGTSRWVLEDSIIKDGSFNIDCGVGVRGVSGEKTGLLTLIRQLDGLKQAQLPLVVLPKQGQNGKGSSLQTQPTLTKLTMMLLTR